MSKQNDLDKIFAIHLLANAMIFIFEDLPETSKFFIENKDLYEKNVKLVEDLTRHTNKDEANNYNYILCRLKKMSERIRLK
jgi:hypothetical protein